MALPNKTYQLTGYGQAISIELDNLFKERHYNLKTAYWRENQISVYCLKLNSNIGVPIAKVEYIPFKYKDFQLNIYTYIHT